MIFSIFLAYRIFLSGLWVACRRRVYILFARLANVRPLLVPLHRASASSKNCKPEDRLFILVIIIIIIKPAR